MIWKKMMSFSLAAMLAVAAAAPVFAEDVSVQPISAPNTANSAIAASNGPEGALSANGWFWDAEKTGWFYRDFATGQLNTGWLQNGDVWYYLENDGKMVSNAWKWIDGQCYYFYSTGEMAAGATVDGYTVAADGAWVK